MDITFKYETMGLDGDGRDYTFAAGTRLPLVGDSPLSDGARGSMFHGVKSLFVQHDGKDINVVVHSSEVEIK